MGNKKVVASAGNVVASAGNVAAVVLMKIAITDLLALLNKSLGVSECKLIISEHQDM